MPFNHYAKIKRILSSHQGEWVIKRIDAPTSTKNFKGETLHYEHYYRIYDANDQPIKYCKFQQLERLASVLGVPAEELPVVTQWRR